MVYTILYSIAFASAATASAISLLEQKKAHKKVDQEHTRLLFKSSDNQRLARKENKTESFKIETIRNKKKKKLTLPS